MRVVSYLRDRAVVCLVAAYLIGFGPTVMIAFGGVANLTIPKLLVMETPPRFDEVKDEVSVRWPSIDKIRFSSLTSVVSGPSTETPNDTDPDGIIVSRLSSIWTLDFARASSNLRGKYQTFCVTGI